MAAAACHWWQQHGSQHMDWSRSHCSWPVGNNKREQQQRISAAGPRQQEGGGGEERARLLARPCRVLQGPSVLTVLLLLLLLLLAGTVPP